MTAVSSLIVTNINRKTKNVEYVDVDVGEKNSAVYTKNENGTLDELLHYQTRHQMLSSKCPVG